MAVSAARSLHSETAHGVCLLLLPMSRFRIEVANEQTILPIDPRRLKDVVREVLAGEARTAAEVSIAVVDDAAIRKLNAKYLGHDLATDALSFVLEEGEGRLEGQII